MTGAATGRVVTALDLPAASPGGSVELLYDLYTGHAPLIDAKVFMLPPAAADTVVPAPIQLLPATGKCLDGPSFHAYVTRLRDQLAERVDARQIATVHLQHLTFGATPALIRLLPDHPRLALVHGTDLLFAAAHRTQHRVLHQTVRACRAIVVPTTAMADHLLHLAPHARHARIEHIPWGVPDSLLAAPPPARPRTGGPLRLLYAGRLTPEKGLHTITETLTSIPGLHLSIAGPPAEYTARLGGLERTGGRTTYLGWLPRHQLWQAFADHDALIMPSTTLEAFGLVALEAQACGLPVLYRPVPGLVEVLNDSALAADLGDPAAFRQALRRLSTDHALSADLRTAGFANAARFPLSATAAALTSLSEQIT
ncbi:glycosyltransferase family 4 protein [Nonomuraea sp. NPDC050478]|uniref:glycosyltransferase family 4 protein n=1 Tax=Nonomuraea sp. NPDC050478 TaxID=3364365 RepID=UPI0037920A21